MVQNRDFVLVSNHPPELSMAITRPPVDSICNLPVRWQPPGPVRWMEYHLRNVQAAISSRGATSMSHRSRLRPCECAKLGFGPPVYGGFHDDYSGEAGADIAPNRRNTRSVSHGYEAVHRRSQLRSVVRFGLGVCIYMSIPPFHFGILIDLRTNYLSPFSISTPPINSPYQFSVPIPRSTPENEHRTCL